TLLPYTTLFRSRIFRIIDMREIPRARDAHQLAVRSPGPAMERAAYDFQGIACAVFLQLHSAMFAAIDKRFDRPVILPEDQGRIIAHVKDMAVFRIGDMFLAARKQPGFGPHLIHFVPMGLLAVISRIIYIFYTPIS